MKLINLCFKGEEKQYIAVTKFGAIWADDKNKFRRTFDKASQKLAIIFCLITVSSNFDNLIFNNCWNLHGL